MNSNEALINLKNKHNRKNSVLVISGTGIWMWHYYKFFKNFNLDELNEFAGIYAFSGGAGSFFYNILELMNIFEEKQILTYDRLIRRELNRGTLAGRIYNLIKNKYIYDVKYLADGILLFANEKARNYLFRDFPLNNFIILGHDDKNNKILLLKKEKFGEFNLGDILTSACFPRRISNRKLAKPLDFKTFTLSDFDFSGSHIKKEFRDYLKKNHSDKEIYFINIYKSSSNDNYHYIKVCDDKNPKLRQITDFLSFFIGLPNFRKYIVS